MNAPKDNAEHQAAYRARQRAAGLKELRNFWAHHDDEEAIRAYAARLAKKRLKTEAKK